MRSIAVIVWLAGVVDVFVYSSVRCQIQKGKKKQFSIV